MGQEIKEIYDGLTILLVFITMLMNTSQKNAGEIIDENIANGKKEKLKNQLKKINKFIFSEWLILLIVNGALLWVLTPTSVRIIQNCSIDLVNFDIAQTIYIVIYLIMCYFTVSYLVVSKKLYNHRQECIKEIKKLG